ncbi:hypothetical protein AMATHDRAFT_59465 [Amanita thiersii Skay4041]|uniref:RING-type domain-containing protein n=1 Tax=Amanita thiersii Skay4041 TaxID=703135 RepID=A0A2A9NTV3_9AGAR|nr:hypothetical protein AMATHDRAFT_59465 [Amanita thiersii Skay4041]
MDQDMSDIPFSQPFDSPPSTSNLTDPITADEDTDMDVLPTDISRSEDSSSQPPSMIILGTSSEFGSELSSTVAQEAIMQAVNDEQNSFRTGFGDESRVLALTPITVEPRPAVFRSNNRRARVDDDEDEERDRRHPSQRISSAHGNRPTDISSPPQLQSSSPQSSPSRSQSRPLPSRLPPPFWIPAIPRLGYDNTTDPLRFFQHLVPTLHIPSNSMNPQADDNNTPPTNNSDPDSLPQNPTSNATTNPATTATPAPQVQAQEPNGGSGTNDPFGAPGFALFAETMARLGLLGAMLSLNNEAEAEDPERARKLVDGLEEVPVGLAKRLERVGGTDGGTNDRDSMCAICYDRLLDPEAGFGNDGGTVDKPQAKEENVQESACINDASTPSTSDKQPSTSEVEPRYPKIVTLPCAHAFHASCLIPWFSRPKQTTCPTCRFNLDPENLTRTRRRRARTTTAPLQPQSQAIAQDGSQLVVVPTTGDTDDATNPPAPDQNQSPTRPHIRIIDQLQIPIMFTAPPSFAPSIIGGARNHDMASQASRQPVGQTPDTRQETPNLQQPITDATTTSNGAGQTIATDDIGISTTSLPHAVSIPSMPSQNRAQPDPDSSTNSSTGNPATHPAPMRRDNNEEGTYVTIGIDMFFDGPVSPNDGNMMDIDGQGNGNGDATRRQPTFIPLHIGTGTGRTISEAMAQLFSGLGIPVGNRQTTNTQNTPVNTSGATSTSASGAASGASQNSPAETNDQNQQDRGVNMMVIPGIESLPFQMVSQLFGFGSPIPLRQRPSQSPSQGQSLGAMPALASSREGTQSSSRPELISSVLPLSNTDMQPSTGQTSPTTTNGGGTDGAQIPFARFFRDMGVPVMSTNIPMGTARAAEGDSPQVHVFPPLPPFLFRPDAPTSASAPSAPAEKKQWAPPPAPGPTLRQRVEKKEREAGLRCHDVSCGIGPSDDDPFVSVTEVSMKQLSLQSLNGDGSESDPKTSCPHTFHPSCLVSTERVASRGADTPVVGDNVEVSCSVCRSVGRVSKKDWEEGALTLS